MKAIKPSVLVRLETDLNDDKKNRITSSLNKQPGVTEVMTSKIRSNLLIVEYDAIQTSLLHILTTVKNEDKSAFLVGM